jgi:uncharacterized protein YbjT (DUF2867 family)
MHFELYFLKRGVFMSGIVLVCGAAGGGQGATGRQVAQRLLVGGVPVRAFVRTFDERADELRALGAEVVAGDLREIADVTPALADVDRVFFTYPVIDGLLDATAVVAAAAHEAGVRRLVEVSQLRPRVAAASPRTRQHWVSEHIFDHADVGAVHLRATIFYENMRALAMAGAEGGELAVPLGPPDTTIPLVSARDVAAMATALLTAADPVASSYRLVGTMPTVAEIVADFAAALGVPLRYRDADSKEWEAHARARGATDHTIAHLSRLWRVMGSTATRDEAFRITPAIAEVTGAAPETLREFLSRTVRVPASRHDE